MHLKTKIICVWNVFEFICYSNLHIWSLSMNFVAFVNFIFLLRLIVNFPFKMISCVFLVIFGELSMIIFLSSNSISSKAARIFVGPFSKKIEDGLISFVEPIIIVVVTNLFNHKPKAQGKFFKKSLWLFIIHEVLIPLDVIYQ